MKIAQYNIDLNYLTDKLDISIRFKNIDCMCLCYFNVVYCRTNKTLRTTLFYNSFIFSYLTTQASGIVCEIQLHNQDFLHIFTIDIYIGKGSLSAKEITHRILFLCDRHMHKIASQEKVLPVEERSIGMAHLKFVGSTMANKVVFCKKVHQSTCSDASCD